MKRCQCCRSSSLQIMRESVVQRGGHEYRMTWLTCRRCQEVNFSFRRLDLTGSPLGSSDEPLARFAERQREPAGLR